MSGALSKSAVESMLVGNVACEESVDLGKTNGALIRLKIKTCDGIIPSRIVNKQNGYIGEAISTGKDLFTTDYIDLKEGVNLIEISRKLENGNIDLQRIKVERLPAATDDGTAEN